MNVTDALVLRAFQANAIRLPEIDELPDVLYGGVLVGYFAYDCVQLYRTQVVGGLRPPDVLGTGFLLMVAQPGITGFDNLICAP